MKKIAILLVFMLFMPIVSEGAGNVITLRSSNNVKFLRIVLEGDISIIGSARVYQRTQRILVRLGGKGFSVDKKDIGVPFKKDDTGIMFYPGAFRGLKVFRLKNPDRLVIDVYLKDKKEEPSSNIQPGAGKDEGPSVLYSDRPFEEPKKKAPEPDNVVIDPGHGGYDNGLISGRFREKNIVLDISRKLNALLSDGSFKGQLTRGSDRFMSQVDRIKYSNDREPEMFLSIHIGDRKEVVIYMPVITDEVSDVIEPYLNNKGQEGHMQQTISLLNAMKEALTAEFGEGMVLVQPLPYSLLSKIETAALMIELPSFKSTVYEEKVRTRMANGLYKGFSIYEENKTKED